MNRPFFQYSIDKLELAFERANAEGDLECIKRLEAELRHRKTQRAVDLAEQVRRLLVLRGEQQAPPHRTVPRPPLARSGMHTPTPEQEKAIEAFRTGGSLKINAYAGTGKTATLEMLARSTSKIGQYIAFNSSIVDEAKSRFPETLHCATTHSLAFRATPHEYRGSLDKMTGKVNAYKLADLLNLSGSWRVDQRLTLDRIAQAGIILKTVQRFAQSSDREPTKLHVMRHGALLGASESSIQAVEEFALKGARHIWARMLDANDQIPLGHDGYLKLWALSEPQIGADFILLDEAQDTNPVVLEVLKRQSAQLVYVGDRYQQIYEWRGAINAMEEIKTTHQTSLRRSFRFGDAIAAAATKVLSLLDERNPIYGNPVVMSKLCPTNPNAVLARTNATTITALLAALDSKQSPHLVGGTRELMELLNGVTELKRGLPSSVPDFFGFQNWNEVVAFSEKPEGENLLTFVKLVESRGEKQLMWALNRTVDEKICNIVISTAHKAKGREWSRVRLMDDFLKSRPSGRANDTEQRRPQYDPAELRLFYVAMTRAREELELSPNTMQLLDIGAASVADRSSVDQPWYAEHIVKREVRTKPESVAPNATWTPPNNWSPGSSTNTSGRNQSNSGQSDPNNASRAGEVKRPKIGLFKRLFG